MNGYIRALITIPNGYMKFGLMKLFHIKNVNFGKFPRVSKNTEISIDNGAELVVGEKINMRECARIRVRKGGKLIIGDNVSLNLNNIVTCHDYIEIGNDVQFSPNVQVYDHDHDYRVTGGVKKGKYKKKPIKIGNNVWIGANSIILRGAKIGDGCVVAAGTIVRGGEYPSGTLIYNKRMLKVQLINECEEI